jgi:hypothetical protein
MIGVTGVGLDAMEVLKNRDLRCRTVPIEGSVSETVGITHPPRPEKRPRLQGRGALQGEGRKIAEEVYLVPGLAGELEPFMPTLGPPS